MKVLKKLESGHFEGDRNLNKGSRKGDKQILEEVINEIQENANIVKLTSDASAGGAATEPDLAVTGLLATDIILAVTQKTPGANNLALLGYADQKDGSMDFIYFADPGADAIMEVLVARALV